MDSILVVDDQPEMLESIRMTLGLSGYCVCMAGTGAEALDILQSQPIDLILTDVEMPKLDGYQLCRRVRANEQWNAVPLLVLSAHGDAEDMRFAKSLGADAYLLKPIEPEALLVAVRLWLRVGAQRAQCG